MKINKDIKPLSEKRSIYSKSVNDSPSVFQSVIKSKQIELQNDELSQLIDKIDEKGKRLTTTQTIKDFHEYKRLIQQFINKAVSQGLSLKETRSWFQQGGSKMKIISKINKKLVDMADQMVSREKNSVRLLQQVGELKGLIINLYR